MIGRVVSNKMQKSAVVLLEFSVKHPLYKKAFKKSKKYLVDDPIGVGIGDIVEFVKVKPISKNKHWRIAKILGQDFAEIAEVQLKQQAEKEIKKVMPEESEDQIKSDKSETSESGTPENRNTDTPISPDLSGKPKKHTRSKKGAK